MLSFVSRLFPALLIVLAMSIPAAAEQGMAIDPATCLGCHSNKISASPLPHRYMARMPVPAVMSR